MNREDLLKSIAAGAGIVDCYACLVDSTRKSEVKPATIKLALPDEIVKSMRGAPDKRPDMFIVFRSAAQREAMQSRIIKPGDILPPTALPKGGMRP